MAYLFIYTRLENFDYRLVYAPECSFLPKDIRSEFIDFAREVIDSDLFGDISSARNAMIKRGSKTMIGLGINAQELDVIESTVEKRSIRVFLGLCFDNAVSDAQLCTLLDQQYYRTLYKEYITPLWGTNRRYENKVNSNIQSIEIPAAERCPSHGVISVNQRNNVCQIHPADIDTFSLFKACIKNEYSDAVTLLNSENHILKAPMYKFHNATVLDSLSAKKVSFNIKPSGESIESTKKNSSDEKRKTNKKEQEESSPKNEIREKIKTVVNKDTPYTDKVVKKIINLLLKLSENPDQIIYSLAKEYGLAKVFDMDTDLLINKDLSNNNSKAKLRENRDSASGNTEIPFFSKENGEKGISKIRERFNNSVEEKAPANQENEKSIFDFNSSNNSKIEDIE